MNKCKKNSAKKGSSTILVILIVLTVLLFGVMNMMSVYTSYKISKKNLAWTQKYYELDSKAQIFANDIRAIISKDTKNNLLDTKALNTLLKNNLSNDKLILVNNKEFNKNSNIELLSGDINLSTYYLDEDHKKRLFININIPQIKGNKPFDILSWKQVNEEFDYSQQPQFSQGGDFSSK